MLKSSQDTAHPARNKLHYLQGVREVYFIILMMIRNQEIADDIKDRKLPPASRCLYYTLLVQDFKTIILDIHDVVTFTTGFNY
jgi:hypothetical protein